VGRADIRNSFDILIKNACIVDGTGSKPYTSDIAVKDGLIAEIAPSISGSADEIIDAEGKITAPGFIDVHRHADSRVLDENFGELELRQGITTLFSGNCGLSLVPCPHGKQELLYPYLEPIMGEMPWKYSFNTFGDYAGKLEGMKLPVSFGCFIGNNTVRIAAKGFERGELTAEEKERVRAHLAEALENGARGVSLGIMYVPENCYSIEEYKDIFRDLHKYDPVLTTHIRGEGNTLAASVAEVIKIAENAGTALHISHLKAAGGNNWRTGKAN
jgi:N-acyl-D-aspartate/D-glutamate deacylase